MNVIKMSKTAFRIVFSSDIHGNSDQYKKVFSYAIANEANCVLIGGDIAPKAQDVCAIDYYDNMFQQQRQWLTEEWPHLLHSLQSANIPCYLILGNGDVSLNYDLHLQYEKEKLCTLVNNTKVKLNDDFDLIGYPFVPFSYSSMKDFEKFDMSTNLANICHRACPQGKWLNDLIQRSQHGKHNHAYRSTSPRRTFTQQEDIRYGWHRAKLSDDIEDKDSILLDLQQEEFVANAEKTVYMFHSPPHNTALDVTSNNSHVGSVAISHFIHTHQPYLTLHGHIHETVQMSGHFKETMGKTIMITSGNDPLYRDGVPKGKHVYLIDIDLYEPNGAQRIMI